MTRAALKCLKTAENVSPTSSGRKAAKIGIINCWLLYRVLHGKGAVDLSRRNRYCLISITIMSDQEIQALESQFPPVSGQAFAEARTHVLASGQCVLQSEGGVVYRVFPNGRKEEVKKIDPPTPVKAGEVYILS
jgi:hypothetical protein